jgi:parvulin-like peptidyl-prolyl isomerase
VDAYYEEQFVGPDRERYKDNVERFEEEIVAGNNEAFYIPEGYRYIRQITLDYPKAATAAAKAQENRMKNALNALASRFQKLAVAATTAEGWDDLKDLRADYDAANEVVAEAQTAWMEKVKAGAQPLLQETFDAIAEEYAAGIDFKSLIEKYSSDKTDMNLSKNGYLFHPDSTTWPETFKEAAMKLQKPGDISEPVYSETGVHILCYVGEAPAGDHALTEEEREQLNASALQYYQNERLLELCAQWKGDYEIETHPELLEY